MTTPADIKPLPIVVGVDKPADGSSAVSWAAAEAVRSARPLKLVTVTESAIVQTPAYLADPIEFDQTELLRSILDRTAAKLRRDVPDLEVAAAIRIEEPVLGLVAEARDACMIVVGKRGLGAWERLTVGSTSIALAGRSTAPTVIVPDVWRFARSPSRC
jgi:nucleotide-binding universal stress UspA family protein